MMRKIFLAAFALLLSEAAFAFNPVRQVQISTNSLSQQSGSFNVSGGTMTTGSISTLVSTSITNSGNITTGSLNVTGNSTFTAFAVFSGTTSHPSGSTDTISGTFDFSGSSYPYFKANLMLSTLWNYRRPVLQWSSASKVFLSTNSQTANTSTILFPDGEVRSVTENVASSQKYRGVPLATQAFWASSSTVQSGVLGSTGSANQMYDVLAVKVSSSGLTGNFVLVASTIEASIANISVLNTIFGANSWVPIGLLSNGNDDSVVTTLVQGWNNFVQRSDGWTILLSTFSGNTNIASQGGLMGKLMATSASATSITYTTVRGMNSRQIPNIVDGVNWVGCHQTGSTNGFFMDVNSIRRYSNYSGVSGGNALAVYNASPDDGLLFTYTTASAGDIGWTGWHDSTLSGGSNPPF